jgi:hypothetical protein
MSEPNPQLRMNHFDVAVTTDVAIDDGKIFTDSTRAEAIAARDAGIQKVSELYADEIT